MGPPTAAAELILCVRLNVRPDCVIEKQVGVQVIVPEIFGKLAVKGVRAALGNHVHRGHAVAEFGAHTG